MRPHRHAVSYRKVGNSGRQVRLKNHNGEPVCSAHTHVLEMRQKENVGVCCVGRISLPPVPPGTYRGREAARTTQGMSVKNTATVHVTSPLILVRYASGQVPPENAAGSVTPQCCLLTTRNARTECQLE